MKVRISILPALLLFAVVPVSAQVAWKDSVDFSSGGYRGGELILRDGSYLRQLQKRDSVLIADQLEYGFELRGVPDSACLAYPEVEATFMENMVTVRPWAVDTLRVQKVRSTGAKLYDIRAGIVVAPFEPGRYELPPLFVQRISGDGTVDTLRFNPQTLDVTTIQIDTATFVPHDLKGQIRYPLTLAEVVPWVLAFFVAVLLAVGAVCLVIINRKRSEGPAYEEPAHITALRKLDRFRGDKFWEPEKQKVFYSGVTDALREYISKRYGIGAMEMTTAEIFSDMKGTDVPADLYEEMKELFERADFVKFAKYTVPKEENASVLPQAVRFVTSTYQSEVEDEASGAATEEEKPAEESPERAENDEDYMPK